MGHALTQLCAEHRVVICRSYYQGLTTAQIAADLGITDAMVKSRLHYALRALRQTLQQRMVTDAQPAGTWPPNLTPTPRSPGSMLLDDNTA
jgi:DNA-directed RNA polymerase specialized sigma24 family protein